MYVELIYAPTPQSHVRKKIPYVTGMTIADMMTKSGIALDYPEVMHFSVGIFSRSVPRTTLVKPGDRVEIYRPLVVDPKEKRRQRSRK